MLVTQTILPHEGHYVVHDAFTLAVSKSALVCHANGCDKSVVRSHESVCHANSCGKAPVTKGLLLPHVQMKNPRLLSISCPHVRHYGHYLNKSCDIAG